MFKQGVTTALYTAVVIIGKKSEGRGLSEKFEETRDLLGGVKRLHFFRGAIAPKRHAKLSVPVTNKS